MFKNVVSIPAYMLCMYVKGDMYIFPFNKYKLLKYGQGYV